MRLEREIAAPRGRCSRRATLPLRESPTIPRVLIAGNWKMFKGAHQAREFAAQVRLVDSRAPGIDVVVCRDAKAALEQLSAVLAAENTSIRVYWVDPGDLRTDMHQAAYPGEDISDRPLPEVRVPAFIQLLEGDLPSGRYSASELGPTAAEAA